MLWTATYTLNANYGGYKSYIIIFGNLADTTY